MEQTGKNVGEILETKKLIKKNQEDLLLLFALLL